MNKECIRSDGFQCSYLQQKFCTKPCRECIDRFRCITGKSIDFTNLNREWHEYYNSIRNKKMEENANARK